jgi:hypothetical protein
MLSVDEEKSNEEYLGKCKVTENDPAILFDWNFEVLQQSVIRFVVIRMDESHDANSSAKEP